MREFPVNIAQALKNGVYSEYSPFINRPFLMDCIGFVPTEQGLYKEEEYDSLWSPRVVLDGEGFEQANGLRVSVDSSRINEGRFFCNSIAYHLGRFWLGGFPIRQIDELTLDDFKDLPEFGADISSSPVYRRALDRELSARIEDDTSEQNCIIFSRVGDNAEQALDNLARLEKWQSGEQGFIILDEKAIIRRIAPLGDSIIAYTDEGIFQIFLSERGAARVRLISLLRLLHVECVSYSRNESPDRHVFIDSHFQIYSLINGQGIARVERQGHRDYIKRNFNSGQFIAFYDEKTSRYIFTADRALVTDGNKVWSSASIYRHDQDGYSSQKYYELMVDLPPYTNDRQEIFRLSTLKLVAEGSFEDAKVNLVGYDYNPLSIGDSGVVSPHYAGYKLSIRLFLPNIDSISSVQYRIQNEQRINTRGQSSYTADL